MEFTFNEISLFVLAATLPAMIISLIATFVVRKNAERWGLLDLPDDSRKVHTTPTPLGGGIGIWCGVFMTFLVGTIVALLCNSSETYRAMLPETASLHLPGVISKLVTLWVLLGAGTLLMLVGLFDDRWAMGWKLRLLLQFGIAIVCVVWQGWRLTAYIDIPFLTALISVVWIVALINSFNMLDNMDGLSGGVAAIASFFLAGVMLLSTETGSSSPQLFVAGFLLVIAGSLLGFLFHNRPPAKVFMGDAGSYFVGFSIAIATLLATYTGFKTAGHHAILAPVFVMAVPMYDMLTVLAIRIKEGRSPFAADKSHLSHRLVDLGFTKSQAVLTIYLLTATCGLAAMLLHRVDIVGAVILAIIVICILTLIALIEITARQKMQRNDLD